MKTLLTSLLIFGTWLLAQGQIDFKITEENKAMSKGSYNALVIQLPNTSSKQVNKLWNKYLKNFKGKTKYDRKGSEYFSDNAYIKGMSDNTVDITAKIYDKGEQGTELAVWFNLGVTYLSSQQHAERYPIGAKVLQDFGLLVSSDLIEAQLKEEEKILESMNDTLKTLVKEEKAATDEIAKQENIIKKAEEHIEGAKQSIEESQNAQNEQTEHIKAQEKRIEAIRRKLKELK